MTGRIFLGIITLTTSLCSFSFFPVQSIAQQSHVLHLPEASLKLPGLLRRLKLKFAGYSIERHPGWLAAEEFDSATNVTLLTCSDPGDSTKIFLRCSSHRYDVKHFHSKQWDKTKDEIKTGYGDHGVGVMVLFDSSLTAHPRNGVIGRFEVLAKYHDRVEYTAALMTRHEALLLSAPIPTDEFDERLRYYRTIVADIRSQ